jgi:hypothetical protein
MYGGERRETGVCKEEKTETLALFGAAQRIEDDTKILND